MNDMNPDTRNLWEIASGRPAPILTTPTEPGLYMAVDEDAPEWGSIIYRLAPHGHWQDAAGHWVSPREAASHRLVRLIPANKADL